MTIAAVEELAEEFGRDFCGIVVCGGGLKQQWVDQINAFTCTACKGWDLNDPSHPDHEEGHVHVDSAPVLCIDGSPDKRWDLYDQALREKPRYVVLGYDQVIDDNNRVLELPQMYVVADEVTTIKSPSALITEAFRDTFGQAPFRFGLTGTPMENGRPEELFQIMVWIDDTVLGRADLFDQTFVKRNKWGKAYEYINLPLFHEMMQECSVSLHPDDPAVSPYMPTMLEPTRVLIEFDEESARLYNLMADDLIAELAAAAKMQRGGFDLHAHYAGDSHEAEVQGKIMSRITCMRMLCAHPDQLIGSAEEYAAQVQLRIQLEDEVDAHLDQYGDHEAESCPLRKPSGLPNHPKGWPKVTKTIKGKKVKVPKAFSGSAYAAELLAAGELDALIETPKMDEVCLDAEDVLAGECKCCIDLDGAEQTNKLVIFSYHKLALRILENRFPDVSVRYDGDMSLKARDAAKKLFQRDPLVRIFLTSDAGGYGVDLPQANHLFNFDKPFTAGRVTQRNARIRRANLEYHQAVHVRDYLIDGSLEVYYADVTESKEKVVQAVRTGKGHVKGALKVNASSLGAFLSTHDV